MKEDFSGLDERELSRAIDTLLKYLSHSRRIRIGELCALRLGQNHPTGTTPASFSMLRNYAKYAERFSPHDYRELAQWLADTYGWA